MFTERDRIEKSARGFYSCPSILQKSPIDNVGLFPFDDAFFPSTFSDPDVGRLVIGKQAEMYLRHWIVEHDRYTLLADHLQVHANNVTLGELDFLLRANDSEELIHLELACKWYLWDDSMPEGRQWTGPNRKDFLADKLEKLEKQQFALLHREETQVHLQQIGIRSLDARQALLLKGMVFMPSGIAPEDPLINPASAAGQWGNLADFLSQSDGGVQYYVPNKKEWLIAPSENNAWFTRDEILNELIKSLNEDRSPMVWIRTHSGDFKRYFIVWWK